MALSDQAVRWMHRIVAGFACLFVFMGFICLCWGASTANHLSATKAAYGGVGTDTNNGKIYSGGVFTSGMAARSADALQAQISCSGMRDLLWANESLSSADADPILKPHYTASHELRDWKEDQCNAQKDRSGEVIAGLCSFFAIITCGYALFTIMTEKAHTYIVTPVLIVITMMLTMIAMYTLRSALHPGGLFLDCDGLPDVAYSNKIVEGQICKANTDLNNVGAESPACINLDWKNSADPDKDLKLAIALYTGPTAKCYTDNAGNYEDVLAKEFMLSVTTARAGASMVFIAMWCFTLTTAWSFAGFFSRHISIKDMDGGAFDNPVGPGGAYMAPPAAPEPAYSGTVSSSA